MRTLAAPGAPSTIATGEQRGAGERCEICNAPMPDDHRHLLHLEERRIVCSCEACWAMHSGDPEYRPAGMRTLWLEGFDCDDEIWGSFQIPIGLAFFMRSGTTGGIVAFYPSPAGATESELDLLELGRTRPAQPGAFGARSRRGGVGRQPTRRSAAVRDSANRRLLSRSSA